MIVDDRISKNVGLCRHFIKLAGSIQRGYIHVIIGTPHGTSYTGKFINTVSSEDNIAGLGEIFFTPDELFFFFV